MAEEQEKAQPQAATPAPQELGAQAAAAEPAQAATVAEPAPSETAPPLPEGVRFIWGTGRRKKAVARVRIRPGTGSFLVNNRKVEEYFLGEKDLLQVQSPLAAANMPRSWDVFVNVNGGGFVGQAGAVALGLARALSKAAPAKEAALRDRGLMTRDARMKERKKYGQKGARKRFQWTKR